MEFEWDTGKARANENKHGVSFYEASEVFNDNFSLAVPDPDHSLDEARYLIFGKSHQDRYLLVSYTERNSRIRIISARLMTSKERKTYEQ
jgi:uncharacterized protein